MPTLTLEDAKITQAIGILWRVEKLVPTQFTTDQIHKTMRRKALEHAFMSGSQLDELGNMPFTLTLPCGNSITYPDIDDIPMADIPCPCGNPTHWFVKYEEEE